MRVASQGWRAWTANQSSSFVFDESCEHEVEVDGSEPRTVLLVDFANPLLVSQQDYMSMALRLDGNDGLRDTAPAAEAQDAAKEWQQAQAHWVLHRQAANAEL
jgi:hypothetical protein